MSAQNEEIAARHQDLCFARGRTALILGLVFIPLFGGLDYFIAAGRFRDFIALRLLDTAFIALIFVWTQFFPERAKRSINLWVAVYFLSAGWMIGYMCELLGGVSSPYYAGLNLVILAMTVIMPWPGLFTAATSLLIVAFYVWRMLRLPGAFDAAEPWINNLYFSLSTVFISSVSSVLQHRMHQLIFEKDLYKTRFFANLSHEFRTPITLTLGPIEGMLRGRFGELPAAAAESLEIIRSNQNRLLDLVNQLLDLAKMEAGKTELKPARISDPHRFIENRFRSFAPLAEKRGLKLLEEFHADLRGRELYADPEKLDRVFLNLFSNALKFTRTGYVKVSTRIEDGRWVIAVRDTGVGIRADQIPRLFERFRQADGSESREFAGTGLGLSLVKEIISLHQGEIQLESQYGRGTTVTLRLPFGAEHFAGTPLGEEAELAGIAAVANGVPEGQSRAEQIAQENEATSADQAIDPERPAILYVDDNPDLRSYVKALLREKYHVFLAENGEGGLAMAHRFRPVLILSDLMMPKMTGSELCLALRAEPTLSHIPFVLLTAKATSESRVTGLESGADDYLTKPFSEPELLARVGNLVKLRKEQMRLKSELRAARAIQEALLPGNKLVFPFASVEALHQPCEDLSGDFFDCWAHGDWLYIYVADVTSHGTASAQVTYLLKGLFRSQVETAGDGELAALYSGITRRYSQLGLTHDASIQIVRFRSADGRVEYLRGGAPPALLLRQDEGEAVLSATPSPGLRSSLAAAANDCTVKLDVLNQEDALYLYTDGCYEIGSKGRPLGVKRLNAILSEAHASPDWDSRVLGELAKHHGSEAFHDDLTLVRLTRTSATQAPLSTLAP